MVPVCVSWVTCVACCVCAGYVPWVSRVYDDYGLLACMCYVCIMGVSVLVSECALGV